MKDFKSPGMFGGKTFKGTNPNGEGVQHGPLLYELPEHPVETLMKSTMGSSESFYEPTGYINCAPEKIEYLKS